MTTPLTREERERHLYVARDGTQECEWFTTSGGSCRFCALLSTIDSLEERVKELEQKYEQRDIEARGAEYIEALTLGNLKDAEARLALMEKVVGAARKMVSDAHCRCGDRPAPHRHFDGFSIYIDQEFVDALDSISEEGK